MKESFLLYKSFYDPIKELSIEDKGHLLDAIFKYQIDGTEPMNTSRIYMPFMFFKNQFRLDDEKYQKIVERNKVNGSKGGAPKKTITTISGIEIPYKKKGLHFIYLILDIGTGFYKIGETSDLLQRRLTIKIPTSRLEIIHFRQMHFDSCNELESDILSKYSEFSNGGDWFNFNKQSIVDEIIKLIDKKPSGLSGNPNKAKKPDNVNEKGNVNEKENKKIIIPSFDEFKNYALENEPTLNHQALDLKYKAWVANDWKDGNDKPIKNWKTKILNTIQYLPKNSNGQVNKKKLAGT
jgi:hypothetical protein